MQKEKVDELDRRWINAIIEGRPESEIRQYKKEYIKASEKYVQETKPKNISPKP
jgi:hypothetical protein